MESTLENNPIKRHFVHTLITVVLLLGATTLIYLYTSGYRISKNQNNVNVDLRRTGLISAKSIPEGANVYINGVLFTATNDTISALDPGEYDLRIIKNGYVPWGKKVEVFAELVTDITAVLISQTPRLEPLTNTGARLPVVSHSLSKLAYLSKDGQESGVWIIPLNDLGISLFRAAPYVAIEDTQAIIYSNSKSIVWSPDEDELLLQTDNDLYYVIDINNKTTQSTASPELLRQTWEAELVEKRQDFIAKLFIPDDIAAIAIAPNTVWSPDEQKFLYVVENGDNLEYRVYNLEKPLPVGEKVENTVFTTKNTDPQPAISWYADSFHLLLVEGDIEKDNRGTISIVRIDGTNKTEVYNNTMNSRNVYSTPGGDKLIFLTSFRSNGQTDLYTIGIR